MRFPLYFLPDVFWTSKTAVRPYFAEDANTAVFFQPGIAGTKQDGSAIVWSTVGALRSQTMNPFVEQHRDEIGSVLSCFDGVVITGTLPDICHPRAMAGYLGYRGIRLFDYARWAEPLREEIRANAEQLAAEAGLDIEFIRKLKAFRKEERVQQILARLGDHSGLSSPIFA
jgi:hypothetical protein